MRVSEEWVMVIAVLALGLGIINTLVALAHGAGLASRIEEWREEAQGQHRDHSRWFAAITERLDRMEATMPRRYEDTTTGEQEAKG